MDFDFNNFFDDEEELDQVMSGDLNQDDGYDELHLDDELQQNKYSSKKVKNNNYYDKTPQSINFSMPINRHSQIDNGLSIIREETEFSNGASLKKDFSIINPIKNPGFTNEDFDKIDFDNFFGNEDSNSMSNKINKNFQNNRSIKRKNPEPPIFAKKDYTSEFFDKPILESSNNYQQPSQPFQERPYMTIRKSTQNQNSTTVSQIMEKYECLSNQNSNSNKNNDFSFEFQLHNNVLQTLTNSEIYNRNQIFKISDMLESEICMKIPYCV